MKRKSSRSALREIKEAGLTVADVWENYKQTLPKESIRFLDFSEQFIKSRQELGRRPAYLRGLRQTFQVVGKALGNPMIESIQSNHLDEWLTSRAETPKARNAILNRLNALFNWGVRKELIAKNSAQFLDKAKFDQTPPAILELHQIQSVLNWAKSDPKRRWFVGMTLGCGVRTTELPGAEFEFLYHKIMVPASHSKVRVTRYMELPGPIEDWVGMVPYKWTWTYPKIHTTNQEARKAASVDKSNVFRHTAATMLLAKHQDTGKVATMLGTSPPVLNKYYLNPVSPETYNKFISLWK